VSSSKASSSVPKPPGITTKPSDSFRNVTLRVKKYRKTISFGSLSRNSLVVVSNGSLIPAPKLFSGPAPSTPASMIPGPAPVITIQSRSASARATSTVWR
jgi:hypothetical protein